MKIKNISNVTLNFGGVEVKPNVIIEVDEVKYKSLLKIYELKKLIKKSIAKPIDYKVESSEKTTDIGKKELENKFEQTPGTNLEEKTQISTKTEKKKK
jgi:hypothetical protein